MFPAARIGDTTTHDGNEVSGLIGPIPGAGLPTVFIEGLPAATAGCLASCSGLTKGGPAHPPPPVPPPIGPGSSTVTIGSLPVLRWAPSPDLGGCLALLGNPLYVKNRTVLIGG